MGNPVTLDDLPMADIASWLELNPPALPYSSLINLPQSTKAYTRLSRVAGQAATGAEAVVSWDTLNIDTIGAFSNGSPTVLTLKQAGLYLVFFTVQATGMSGTGSTYTKLERFDSGNTLRESVQAASNQVINGVSSLAWGFIANTNDYIEAIFNQGANGTSGSVTGALVLVRFQ